MKKQPEQFKQRVEEGSIDEWRIHMCSMCKYPCGYLFEDGEVFYDNGCDCMPGRSKVRESSWDDVANHYNMNAGADDAQERYEENPEFGETIKEMNEFWGFDNPDFIDQS